ncbi:hypothetical protein N9S81_00485 [bacterium]|nr:hypothetical protein [bacterium]
MSPPHLDDDQTEEMIITLKAANVGDVFWVKWHKINGKKDKGDKDKGAITEREVKFHTTNTFNGRYFLVVDVAKTAIPGRSPFINVNAAGLRSVKFLRHE